MRIGFFLNRRNHLKIIGPVAAEAKRRGHEVVAVIGGDGPKDDASAPWAKETGLFDKIIANHDEGTLSWIIAVGLRTAPIEREGCRNRAAGYMIDPPRGGIHVPRWAALAHCGDIDI